MDLLACCFDACSCAIMQQACLLSCCQRRAYSGFVNGDLLSGICWSICSAADDIDAEVLGIQAWDALRHLRKKAMESSAVGNEDCSLVVPL